MKKLFILMLLPVLIFSMNFIVGGLSHSKSTTTPNIVFSDSFDTDTRADYTISGTGLLNYNINNNNMETSVVSKQDVVIDKILPQTIHTGVLSFDINMLNQSDNSWVEILLIEDSNNYYRIYNTDGYGVRYLEKYVNSVLVDSIPFSSEYTQGVNYSFNIEFSPIGITSNAFGEVISINTDTTILNIKSISFQFSRQNATIDNILLVEGL